MLKNWTTASVASVVLATTGLAAAQAPLMGVQFRNPAFFGDTTLYDVDPLTGASTNPRAIAADVALGLTFGPGGTLYSFTDSFGNVNGVANNGGLYTIDPVTGATAAIGTLGINSFSEGDLDFNPVTGELFVIASSGGTTGLHTVDLVTGAATLVGPTAATDASAMAFTDDGRLFVLDTTFSFPAVTSFIREVDPLTGGTVSAIDTGVALGTVAGMDFDPVTGALFVADGDFDGTNQLYTLDVTTGAFTAIGTTVPGAGGANLGGFAGLAFVPAPGTALLLTLGALAGGRRRR